MRHISPPSISHRELFDACMTAVRRPAMRTKYCSVWSQLFQHGNNYILHAHQQSLHEINHVSSMNGVSKKELKLLYDKFLKKNKHIGKKFLSEIRSSADNICPLCNMTYNAMTCEHHLPRKFYPHFSILPENILPACEYCNNIKNSKHPGSINEQTLHPYFDVHLFNEQWLFATIIREPLPAFEFQVKPPDNWRLFEKKKVQHHFEVCDLAMRYGIIASNELVALRDAINGLGHWKKRQKIISDKILNSDFMINSWQHAVYQVLCEDTWFALEGYRKFKKNSI